MELRGVVWGLGTYVVHILQGVGSLCIFYHAVWGLEFRNEGLGLRVSQGRYRYKVPGVMRGFFQVRLGLGQHCRPVLNPKPLNSNPYLAS